MTDNLRDRIAAVQRQHMWGTAQRCICGGHREPSTHPGHVADAVIAELGLRQEWAVADLDGDHVYVGTVEENADKYTVQPGDHKETRYVTEWEPNE
jgi:hypothetical protein